MANEHQLLVISQSWNNKLPLSMQMIICNRIKLECVLLSIEKRWCPSVEGTAPLKNNQHSRAAAALAEPLSGMKPSCRTPTCWALHVCLGVNFPGRDISSEIRKSVCMRSIIKRARRADGRLGLAWLPCELHANLNTHKITRAGNTWKSQQVAAVARMLPFGRRTVDLCGGTNLYLNSCRKE